MIKSAYFPKTSSKGKESRVGNLPAILNRNGLFEFKEGLNIIIGANGSGKTSVVKTIANNFAALDLGYSNITHNWILSNTGVSSEFDVVADIIHDGQGIYYADPRKKLGHQESGNSLEEFGVLAAIENMNTLSESSGEMSLRRILPIVDQLDEEPSQSHVSVFRDSIANYIDRNDGLANGISDLLEAKIPLSQPTIIMDEPGTGLGILSQILFWNRIKQAAKEGKYQLIIVTHSVLALDIPGAHYIEMSEGYRQACLDALNGGTFDKETKQHSFSVQKELTSYQKGIMRKMLKEGKIEFKNAGEAVIELMDLKLVDYYVEVVPKTNLEKQSRTGRRSFRSRD